ncbi:4-hydroxy-tetrahydrodipicolinate synthase [Prosthecobacter debontii]|uniref:4-hydroxy-tetrahydrodipicolinate synthase n=2 Tax=Prosthecobacter debontii TaxID=48467 RepID=A0A1T4YHA9_9BACT|nr:4-hydroxy-tetrahydrodipicolinate synthase [Prosthecobacter debontii]
MGTSKELRMEWRKRQAVKLPTMSLPQPLRGIIPPLVTPLSGRDTLDVAGLERLIEHLLSGGVHGLFILGTTGEAPSLSYRLRRELIERTCQLVKGRVPVLVGITDTAFVESVDLARYSADQGASAVVTAPPYYFPAAPPELMEYIQDLVEEMPLPLFLYNMPGLTKVSFEIDLVRRALDMPGICGVKDSSCDMIYFHRLIEVAHQRPEWSILVGPEELTAEAVLLGGHGGINGGANLHPSLYVKMYEAAAAQDLQRTRELHRQVMSLAGSIYTVGRHKSAIIKGIKCALSLLGICDDQVAEPFHRFNPPERELIRERLTALGLIH